MSDENESEISEISDNIMRICEQSTKVMEAFLENQKMDNDNVMMSSQKNVTNAFSEMLMDISTNPEKLAKIQMDLYSKYMDLFFNYANRFVGNEDKPAFIGHAKDRRFHDEWWSKNLTFDFIKQSYFLSCEWLEETVDGIDNDIDPKTKQKIGFYTKQFTDALSPTNFAFTNPEVIRETVSTNGENLVKGLENLLSDINAGKGHFKVSIDDREAFKVGKNLAITKGSVIYQNELVQLIQYSPTTKKVHETPIFIVSPWINKYYILDMRQDNSLVKWLVDKGHTVFITSWVNPEKKHAHINFQDYMFQGIIDCLKAIEQATGVREINVAGYCIGGTLLAATLAYLQGKDEASRVKSATYFTTLVDFSDSGDLGIFIDDDVLAGMTKKVAKDGYFHGNDMAFIFSMLRSRELIWSFVVSNYMMGKDPYPFDLLFWNADSTGMPATMHIYYLTNMYKNNMLVKPNGLTIDGVPIDLTTIDLPTYMISTRQDHIAPWRSTYAATQIYKGEKRFVLSGSGHVAGVINPPARNKYGFWVDDNVTNYPKDPEKWLESATEHEGSWWKDWDNWLTTKNYTGKKVAPRTEGDGNLKVIESAPGSYVLKRNI